MSAGALSLQQLTRRYGRTTAVDGLSLELPRGELLALIGASGSGKTTTLRMVAGYETPDAGRVVIDGRDITRVPPQRRDFGMVFQHYALFPHMTVGQNVAFGLEARGVGRAEREQRAARALAGVGLAGAEGRAVQSLSGGEQQRVALARALVVEPRVLLLDEPLSNLDPTLRRTMRAELRATLHRLGVTALFVTHDQEDAFAIADRVALLSRGRLLQVGAAEELYDCPASRAVAQFIGHATLVRAERVRDGASVVDGGAPLPAAARDDDTSPGAAGAERAAAATLAVRAAGATDADADVDTEQAVRITIGGVTQQVRTSCSATANGERTVLAVLRPDALAFTSPDRTDVWRGEVTERRFAGALLAYRVRLSAEVEVELYSGERDVRVGEQVGVRVSREPVAVVPLED
ncbi:MAG TPA: ABC transporter ATP-binding protein [Gemmatimonadaceae bacterium]|nr:ABC transporter ATP-binding protein [Gemmatimonadaceae bacterium]